MPTKRKPSSSEPFNPYSRANTQRYNHYLSPQPAIPWMPVIGAIVGIIGVVIIISLVHTLVGHFSSPQPDQITEPEVVTPIEQRVSFLAVGDNLPDEHIGYWADAQAGEMDDGDYNYEALYLPIKPYVQAADLSYVNQETHIGGDEFGPRGYPSFNTTTQMADAIVNTGFDLVASASNHAYDWGYFGAVEFSRNVWNKQPVVYTGTATNQEEADIIPVVERNGITFALLNYTYGVNGYEQSDLEPYEVNYIDPERITNDVTRAHEMADVVLVAMHWGTENYMAIDDFQAEYAQLLADLEVDVVLGSHPHVIGPMEWVTGVNGNKTLVAYSLGNFLSNHETPGPKNELEGMLTCDFVKDEAGNVGIENVCWVPLVNHTDGNDFAVYAVKDYTSELASSHPILSSLDDPIGWLKQTTYDVIGDEFVIDAG